MVPQVSAVNPKAVAAKPLLELSLWVNFYTKHDFGMHSLNIFWIISQQSIHPLISCKIPHFSLAFSCRSLLIWSSPYWPYAFFKNLFFSQKNWSPACLVSGCVRTSLALQQRGLEARWQWYTDGLPCSMPDVALVSRCGSSWMHF